MLRKQDRNLSLDRYAFYSRGEGVHIGVGGQLFEFSGLPGSLEAQQTLRLLCGPLL